MTEVAEILNFQGSSVRAVQKGDELWFVAQDVCEILSIKYQAHALRKLDDDERGGVTLQSPGGNQEFAAVSESGLYTLIYESTRPEAEAFKRWVKKDVLPSIRKTGRYVHQPYREMDSLDQLYMVVCQMKEQRDRAIAETKRVDSIAEQLCIVAHEAKQENDTLTHDQISELDSDMNVVYKTIGDKDYRHLSRMKKSIKKEFFKHQSTRTYKEIPRSGFIRAKEIIAEYLNRYAPKQQSAQKTFALSSQPKD